MSADAPATTPAPHSAAPDTTNLVPLRPDSAPPSTGPQHLLTPPKQAAFARALANHGNVRLACRAVAISPQTAYRARRASPAFRQCWDAALIIARDHAEQVLADRALNGVEEKVFYHGEEVATRRRYDSRLLLAHLARLDRMVEARETCEHCDAPLLDEHEFDAAIDALGAGGEEADIFAPGQCSMCSTLAADYPDPDDDMPLMERRLQAMEAALPPRAQEESGMDTSEWLGAEEYRLAAYEEGEAHWWLATEADEGAPVSQGLAAR